MENKKQVIIEYYKTLGSRLWYGFILKGIKHFGYYPVGKENISIKEAQKLMMAKVYEKLALKNNPYLLDAGCGEGETAFYLADKYKIRISGIDILDFNIEKANRKKEKRDLKNVDFKIMDYSTLDFGNDTFDGVYTIETLVHAIDYRRVLKEFWRVLKPGGKIVLCEYTMKASSEIPPKLQKIEKIIIEGSGMHSLPNFIHGNFSKILEEAGFINISIDEITKRVIPMLEKFYFFAFLPYQLIKLFGLQKCFVNLTTAAEYKNILKNDGWRYVIVSATKR